MRTRLRGSILTLAARARESQRVARLTVLRGVAEVVEAARSGWPRDTGRSAMLLDAEETERGARALGRADYTAAIVSRGRSPWGSLIRDVRRMAERDLPHRLGRSLVDALRVR